MNTAQPVHAGGGPALLLLFMAAVIFCGALIAIAAPAAEVWWGPHDWPRPAWRVNQMNIWMFDLSDTNLRRPSRAGRVAVRLFGVALLAASIVLLVNGIRSL